MNSGTDVVGVPAMAPAAARWVVVIVGGGARGTGCKKMGWLVLVSRLGLILVVIMTGLHGVAEDGVWSKNYKRGVGRRRLGQCRNKKGVFMVSPRIINDGKKMRCFLEMLVA